MTQRDAPDLDPVAIDEALQAAGELEALSYPIGGSSLGDADAFFTEHDSRFHALWRVAMRRQFRPSALRGMTSEDLLFVAGHRPAGYEEAELKWQERNKLEQNAARAQLELESRARDKTWRREALVALVAAITGAGLTLLGGWALSDHRSAPAPATTVSSTTPTPGVAATP